MTRSWPATAGAIEAMEAKSHVECLIAVDVRPYGSHGVCEG
jgi:hypothetical protein